MSNIYLNKKQPVTTSAKPEITGAVLAKWQHTVDLMARIIGGPAGLIMKAHPTEIEVFVSSDTEGNPYRPGDKERLDTGPYCETVMARRGMLLVPDALEDPEWDDNPGVELNMISYLGLPLTWPDGEVFGTICVLDNKRNTYSAFYIELMQHFKTIVETDLRLLKSTVEHQQELQRHHDQEEVLKQHAARLELINELSAQIAAVLELNSALVQLRDIYLKLGE